MNTSVHICAKHATNLFYLGSGMILGSGILVIKAQNSSSFVSDAFYNQLSFVCSCVHWELYFLSEEREPYKIVIGRIILMVILY